jgi:hypothetical protein
VAFAQAGVGLVGGHGPDLADEGAEGLAQLEGAAGAVAVPERHLAGLAGGGDDDDPVVGDVVDAPGGGAEQEGLADAALEDHLLVELADAGAVGEEDAEQAPVGDGAGVGDRQALGAGAAADGAVDAVPDDAGAQLAELVGGVAAGEQVEGGVEDVVGEVGEGGGAAHDAGEVVDGPVVEGGHGHDLLGEDVEGVAGVAGVFDEAVVHALDDDGGFDEVAAVLGEDAAPAGFADLVAGPADALQAAGHRAGGFDLDDQVDRAHVDAELEAAGGDQALEGAGLELVFDDEAAFSAQGAVVGLDQVGWSTRRRVRLPMASPSVAGRRRRAR